MGSESTGNDLKQENVQTTKAEDPWGYDLYPERKGEKAKTAWWQIAFFGDGRVNTDKFKCEENVYKCFQKSKQNLRFLTHSRSPLSDIYQVRSLN